MNPRNILRTKPGRAALVAAIVLSAVTFLRVMDPGPIAHLRDRTFDSYQQIQPRPYGDFPVRIVDIDEASLAALGQWPWPRTVLASLVKRLNELGAAVVAFDVIFSEPDRTSPQQFAHGIDTSNNAERQQLIELMSKLPDHDQVFAAAIEQAPVVLGFAVLQNANGRRPLVKSGFAFAGAEPPQVLPSFSSAATSLEILDKAASGIAALSVSAKDKGGIIRHIPMLFSDGEKTYPSLSVEALRIAQQQKSILVRGTGASRELDTGNRALVDMRIGEFRIPLTGEGELRVYFDHDRPQRYISVRDILDPAKEDEVRPRIEGQILFVGSSAAGLLDTWPTPLGELVPGVSVHAQAVEQIITQTFLYRPDWSDGLETIVTILLGALLTYLLVVLGAQYSALVGAAILAVGIGASWFAFANFGLLLDAVYPSLSVIFVYLAVLGVLYVATDKEKKFVRRAFGQYLAPELLAKLENAPQMMRLGGETRQITLMFMDVRDFTPISEVLSAAELVDFMNHLLTPLADAIQSELGTIDKFIGDAIMAFWNAPLDIADHPVRACRAALKMRAVLQDLNSRDAFGFSAHNLANVRIGIGINTGMACVGNMGSERRFNYSAMGDVVNTTSRIESNTKELGVDIVISDDSARDAAGFAMLEAGELLMKGKSRPVKLFALVGDEETAASAEFKELAKYHARLMEAIANRQPVEAGQALKQCRNLGGALLSRFYNRFEKQVTELSPGATRLLHVAAV
jgi:adenylate cyclase